MSDNKIVYQGPSLCTLLFITFLILKLCKVITWSWWWVTAPLWIPFGIAGVIFLGMIVIATIVGIVALIVSKLS